MNASHVLAAVAGLSFNASLLHASDAFWFPVRWSHDNVRFVGQYHAASHEKAFTWVLLHGLGSGKGEWESFAQALAADGSGVFVYDARGHGESNVSVEGRPLNYQAWKTAGSGSPWAKMPEDLAAAVRHLSSSRRIESKKIAVGGASLGANVAMVYAERSMNVPAVLLLSPGLNYAGIAPEGAFRRYKPRPIFMAAAAGDAYAFQTVQRLEHARRDPDCRVVLRPGDGHGVNLFDPDFTRSVVSWVHSVEHR
jgi:alpha-beta hydrolase superfamily lysophospholipase